jgi:hypothetical protein
MAALGDRMVGRAPYVLLSAAVLWVTLHALRPLHDPDAWWHLRLGRDFLEQRSFSVPRDWSSFATSSWVPTQPLPEAVMALVEKGFGLPGVVWVYAASLVVLVTGTFFVCRTFGSPLPAVIGTLIFVATAEGAMTPRPQLISYGLVLVVVTAWLRTEDDLRPRWWLVPLTLFWSMCHGFWFLGVGYGFVAIPAIALTTRAPAHVLARLTLVPLASLAAVLLNPVGPRVFVAPFIVGQRGQFITEWQHASLVSGPTVVILVSVGACIGVLIRFREEFTWFGATVALSSVFFAWYAARTVAVGGIVLAPVVTAALEVVVRSSQSNESARIPTVRSSSHGPGRAETRCLIGACLAMLVVMAVLAPQVASEPGHDGPVAFDKQLDALPQGTTVLNDYLIGGWLAWRHPSLNRWIDGLADAYPMSHLRDARTLQFQQHGWKGIVARSGANVAIMEGESRVAAFENLGWHTAARDGRWFLLERAAAHD